MALSWGCHSQCKPVMVVQCNRVKTPPTLLVGLKESIDLFASTWLWPWVGTFEIERLPPKFKTLLQSRIQHQGNHHQHSSTIVPFGYHMISLGPIGLVSKPSAGACPTCLGPPLDGTAFSQESQETPTAPPVEVSRPCTASGPWTTHRFGMILMSF